MKNIFKSLIYKDRKMFRNIIMFLILVVTYPCLADIMISDSTGGSDELVNFKKIDEGESISFHLSANGDTVLARNLPQGATLTRDTVSTSLFQWTPNDTQSGHYTIGFYTDGYNNLTYKSIRVIVSNTQFMITAEQKFTYLFTATDPDDDDVSLRMLNLPVGARFEGKAVGPKLFTWTPTINQLGVHKMILVATDNPESGDPKQDVSNIEITVSLLEPEAMPYDFDRDGKISGKDFSMFSKYWLKGAKSDTSVTLSPDPISPESAIVNLKLDEGSGLIANDSSSSSNNGSISGATWSVDGLYFDGENDFVAIQNSDTLDNLDKEITVSLWIKLGSKVRNTYWQKLFIKPYETLTNPWELICIDLGKFSNNPRFLLSDGIPDGRSVNVSDPNVILDTDVWYNLVGVYNGSNAILYVNGDVVSIKPVDFTIGKNSLPFFVGSRNGVYVFNGYISNVLVYDKALSNLDIRQEYIKNKDTMSMLGNTTVYVSEKDSTYHKIDCQKLSGATTPSSCSMNEALERGLQSCDRCKPEDSQYTSYNKLSLNQILSLFLND